MPKPSKIAKLQPKPSSIAKLQAEWNDRFNSFAKLMQDKDQPYSQVLREMAATLKTVPEDDLAELDYNYDPFLIDSLLHVLICNNRVHDFANAHDLILTMLDGLRRYGHARIDFLERHDFDGLLIHYTRSIDEIRAENRD